MLFFPTIPAVDFSLRNFEVPAFGKIQIRKLHKHSILLALFALYLLSFSALKLISVFGSCNLTRKPYLHLCFDFVILLCFFFFLTRRVISPYDLADMSSQGRLRRFEFFTPLGHEMSYILNLLLCFIH